MEPVTWFLTGMEKHSDEYSEAMYGNSDCFIGAMNYHMANFYAPSLMCAMNELSNHDHSRFLTRTNHKVGPVSYTHLFVYWNDGPGNETPGAVRRL